MSMSGDIPVYFTAEKGGWGLQKVRNRGRRKEMERKRKRRNKEGEARWEEEKAEEKNGCAGAMLPCEDKRRI